MNSIPTPKQEYQKDRLFSYALWYTGKYRISRAKLLDKLKGKSSNEAIIQEVLTQMEPYHSDSIEIRSHIESCLARSKPVSYVIRSLRQKQFIPEEIKTILAEYDQFDDYDTFAKTIEKRIGQLIDRGNGPKGIQQDLIQKYPQFRKRIESRCHELNEEELLEALPIPTLSSPKELKKWQDTLLRKGFSYQSIRRFMGNIASEDINTD